MEIMSQRQIDVVAKLVRIAGGIERFEAVMREFNALPLGEQTWERLLRMLREVAPVRAA